MADDTFDQSFALFDADDRLVEWNDAFVAELSAVRDIIVPGVTSRNLLTAAWNADGVARTATLVGTDAATDAAWALDQPAIGLDKVFEYRDASDRLIRVGRSRTASGGVVRVARDVTAALQAHAPFSSAEVRWCLDGDPQAEAVGAFTIHADGTQSHQRPGDDVRALWGLAPDFDTSDTNAVFSRVVQTPADEELHRSRLTAILATLEPQYLDIRVRGDDERLRWVRFAMTARRDLEGNTHILCRQRDVTRTKVAEDQLELLRSAVTHATDSIQILNTATDETTTVLYVNPAFERLMGWAPDELMGRRVSRPDPGEQAAWYTMFDMAVRGDESSIDVQSTRRDGEQIWVEASAKVVERMIDGSIVWVLVSRDATERRQAQEDLQRARDEAEAANRAKSEFLANMSHEIRTPMNGIIGMNALLLRGELSPEQRTFAQAIKTSADCLLGIINDILDISKLEAGKVELEVIDFSLEKVVEDVVELLAPRALDQGLEMVSLLDEGARAPLRGDPTRLRQILLNLLSNSLKFTERGFVSVEVTSKPQDNGETRLRIEVSDTGVGLTPEAKGRLFKKFQQADGSITRRFGGTGLGLSICREIVELMGGTIGVIDRPGGGSTFWVEVSLAPGISASIEQHRRASLEGVRILVVDDLEINRAIFRRQLEGEGAIVGEAADGAKCLKALAHAQAGGAGFDLVLMDHVMPEVDGDRVAVLIRARQDLHQPRLVLASSIGTPPSADRAAMACFDAFLTKPVRHHALVDCLASLMGSAEPQTSEACTLGAAEAGAADGARILLVEDNAINTLLATTLLEAVGYQVDCAVNGAEAVEAVRRTRFDLILMDVHMPVMDGLEASRRIRALDAASGSAPIVAMTANAMTGDRDACLAAGMNDFVSKPFEPEAFLQVVARYIEQGEAEGPATAAVRARASA